MTDMADTRKLQYHVHVEDEEGSLQVFGPDDTVPAWARTKITNPDAWAPGEVEADEADDDSDEEPAPYGEWTKAELEVEVEKRNEGRADDDLIEVGGKGNKPDLVAALEADDDSDD